ncbi:MAG: ribosome biogenesis GTPase YlqF [Lachnospiraceae bacterium]|nr:ribosome biogenesis GTPase YlqF [Lachnospiraceae bacterium]
MEVQWYPGHMTKARRMMEENIKLIDIVVELVDARVPMSSRNPDIDKLANNKKRILLLNKADLADDNLTKEWLAYYKEQGFYAIKLDSRKSNQAKQTIKLIEEASKEKIERDRKRGIKNRPIRIMVAGIPNVGKSTFINSLVGKGVAKTGDKPGVTKGKQWIKIGKNIDLLDTPGILWPKFEDKIVGIRLAMIGSVNDELLPREELATMLMDTLRNDNPGVISERYNIDESIELNSLLENVAINRNCLKKGAEPDLLKAADIVLDEFRAGTLGRVCLDKPN